MRPALHGPVPSSAVLKFLKSQSEGLCFFSANPRPGFIFDHASPRVPQARSHIGNTISRPSTRCLSTTTPRRANLEAGILNFDSLWPSASKLQPRSAGAVRSQRAAYDRSIRDFGNSSMRSKWRLWGREPKQGGRPLEDDDLQGVEDSNAAFSLGHRISAKAAAQPKLRCTELDENGVVVLASGEFKKSELIAKVFPAATIFAEAAC